MLCPEHYSCHLCQRRWLMGRDQAVPTRSVFFFCYVKTLPNVLWIWNLKLFSDLNWEDMDVIGWDGGAEGQDRMCWGKYPQRRNELHGTLAAVLMRGAWQRLQNWRMFGSGIWGQLVAHFREHRMVFAWADTLTPTILSSLFLWEDDDLPDDGRPACLKWFLLLEEEIYGFDFCWLIGPSPGEDMGDDEEVEMWCAFDSLCCVW